jgi:hypothetical protein
MVLAGMVSATGVWIIVINLLIDGLMGKARSFNVLE